MGGLTAAFAAYLLREGAIDHQEEEGGLADEQSRPVNAFAGAVAHELGKQGWQTSGVLREKDPWHPQLEGTDLRQANLEGADLWQANLKGADLWEANLEGAYLRRANLQGAKLGAARLEAVRLWGANLQGADLWQANLQGADLWHTNLQGADLRKANLEASVVTSARLAEVSSLAGAVRPDGRKLSEGNWKAAFANWRRRQGH